MTKICTMKMAIFGGVILLCFYSVVAAISAPMDTSAQSASELVHALADMDAVARFMAEEELIEMGDAAVPILKPIATAPGLSVSKRHVINVLARIESQKAVDILLHILEQEPEVEIRASICRHLGRLGIEQAVPIIGKWLRTIKGTSLTDWDGPYIPHILTSAYAWLVHVHALREIGSEKGIPILEEMLEAKHGGKAGEALMKAYQQNLNELKLEAAFFRTVGAVPGLEKEVQWLFDFFRRDTLSRMRLYRDKVLHLGLEGMALS